MKFTFRISFSISAITLFDITLKNSFTLSYQLEKSIRCFWLEFSNLHRRSRPRFVPFLSLLYIFISDITIVSLRYYRYYCYYYCEYYRQPFSNSFLSKWRLFMAPIFNFLFHISETRRHLRFLILILVFIYCRYVFNYKYDVNIHLLILSFYHSSSYQYRDCGT